MERVLTVEDLKISFGNNHVLKSVNFHVDKGEILGIIGPNGAGKTVALNIVSGLLKPSSGTLTYLGNDITKNSIVERTKMGIGRTFQVPRSFNKMTALENIMVGGVYGENLSQRQAKVDAVEILKIIKLQDKMLTPAGKLSLLDRKRLEIGMALATKPHLLLCDEVAGGLTESEVVVVLDIIRTISKKGIAVIWIEHVLRTMREGTDRIMCLAEGTDIVCGLPQEVMESKEVAEVYLGADDE